MWGGYSKRTKELGRKRGRGLYIPLLEGFGRGRTGLRGTTAFPKLVRKQMQERFPKQE